MATKPAAHPTRCEHCGGSLYWDMAVTHGGWRVDELTCYLCGRAAASEIQRPFRVKAEREREAVG